MKLYNFVISTIYLFDLLGFDILTNLCQIVYKWKAQKDQLSLKKFSPSREIRCHALEIITALKQDQLVQKGVCYMQQFINTFINNIRMKDMQCCLRKQIGSQRL